jgi:hypothetical protein
VYEKYGVKLWDIVLKPDLARTLIEPRLKEIRDEVASKRYSPNLELEKVLMQVSKRIRFTHIGQSSYGI